MKWVGYAAGGALIVLGLAGLALEGVLIGWALWFGGVLVVHDALLAPGVAAAGTVIGRRSRSLRTALILAGTLVLATLPTVLALGRRADNPSILPLSYGVNLLIVLAAIALLAVGDHLLSAFRKD
ncbi:MULTISPECIES: hypothetical protein [unclassified Nonomuraea]|uniref:hypothetical protein n=1 Tax=unclassified Nonomuraea TaxID=2593643 RepID=UPI001485DBCF|nr:MULTISPECIES: hypothetical protein [unclassified Nonomuraea]